jgi:hypothetical protein
VTVPAFGFGMRPRGTEHAPELSNLTHLVRRRDHDVEVQPPLLDPRDVLDADEVRAGRFGFARLVADGDHEHANRLTSTGRQHHGTADDLVGVARIDAKANGHLDGLVEFRERAFLHHLERLLSLIHDRLVASFRRGAVLLAVSAHQSFTSRPIERAAPATIAIADSIESQLRSGSLISAIFRTCALLTDPTLLRFGCPDPFSIPASFFSNTAAGGVLVMKVKDLSA